MTKSRQRVLKRVAPVPRPEARERPSEEVVTAAYVALARERVAIGADALVAALAARLGLESDDELLLRVDNDVMLDPSGPLTMQPPDVVVHAPALMSGAVLTHRLSAEERADGFLVLDTDLAGFLHFPDPHLGEEEYLEVDEVGGRMSWIGPEDWLTDLPLDALLAVRVTDDGEVELGVLDAVPPVPTGLVEALRTSYEVQLEEPGLPVTAEELLIGTRHAERALFTDPVPPLEELATAAGLERRGVEFAHAESVWEAGAEAARHWRLLDRLGPGGAATTALEVLDLITAGDAASLRRALDVLEEPDLVSAVTDELLADESPERVAAFVVLAQQLVAAAGRSPRAAVARWMAAVAAERDGRVLDAESHLRAACSEAEGWPFVEDRLAWFEADRGDAAAALGRWRAIGSPDSDPDVAAVRPFAVATGPEPGRNEPCSCGSGRKYKQCHLGKPVAAPLPARVGWLWRKAIAYLERRGGGTEEAMTIHALARAGSYGGVEAAFADPLTVDVALHESGWFAEFLRERGPLLPDDEALLGASWLLVDRTIYEVLAVRPGEGLDLRDVRSGEHVTVTERTASRTAQVGMRLCARAVPDGAGHQFVGGVVPVPPGREQMLLVILDERDGLMLLDWAAARAAPPRVLGPDGADLLECTARVRVGAEPEGVLDEAYDPAGEGWARLDADGRVLATLDLDGDVLTVRTLSGPRMDATLADLAVELPEREVLSDERVPVEPGAEPEPAASPVPLDPAALAEIQDQFERRWCEENVPALDGRTPREAVADPTRRDDVARLIDSFPEINPASGAFGMRPWRLRELLGLS